MRRLALTALIGAVLKLSAAAAPQGPALERHEFVIHTFLNERVAAFLRPRS